MLSGIIFVIGGSLRWRDAPPGYRLLHIEEGDRRLVAEGMPNLPDAPIRWWR